MKVFLLCLAVIGAVPVQKLDNKLAKFAFFEENAKPSAKEGGARDYATLNNDMIGQVGKKLPYKMKKADQPLQVLTDWIINEAFEHRTDEPEDKSYKEYVVESYINDDDGIFIGSSVVGVKIYADDNAKAKNELCIHSIFAEGNRPGNMANKIFMNEFVELQAYALMKTYAPNEQLHFISGSRIINPATLTALKIVHFFFKHPQF